MSTFIEWTLAFKDAISDRQRTVCPECGHVGLDFQFIGNQDTKMGHAFVWCTAHHHGIHVSRTRIPEGVLVLPLDVPSAELKKYVPEIELISS
ncbi:hypothetical protein [Acidovorax sp. Leaf84]|uniref:hypothetical protein n=1 Tax=Acidovorax sp. Leaf84 TaxID=1736240 RepID=UPI0012E3A00B|nr:hypothetical protein [Acidovorax sp. Leaf84]